MSRNATRSGVPVALKSTLLTGAAPAGAEVSADEGVHAVARALSILTAFDGEDLYLPLRELARRTGMHKPTALRLARTLATARFLVKREDGAWRLGPAAGWIGSRYQAQFDLNAAIEPILEQLSRATGERASFYVFEGNLRSCLMRCDGVGAIQSPIRSGEVFPLDRGSAGRVILAALGEPGDLSERIRRRGFHLTRGERNSEIASVSSAVRGRHGAVLGSVCVSGPKERLTARVLQRHAATVVRAARQLGEALGAVPNTALRATWHP